LRSITALVSYQPPAPNVASPKLYSTDHAMQIFGASGFMCDLPIERYMRPSSDSESPAYGLQAVESQRVERAHVDVEYQQAGPGSQQLQKRCNPL
jgi:alkylation response protein AidB-like acyl-CoA dehydrogenase